MDEEFDFDAIEFGGKTFANLKHDTLDNQPVSWIEWGDLELENPEHEENDENCGSRPTSSCDLSP